MNKQVIDWKPTWFQLYSLAADSKANTKQLVLWTEPRDIKDDQATNTKLFQH